MKNTNTSISTFEREMQNSAFKRKLEKSYEELLLSELLIALMESEEKSIRELAKEVGLSATVIQKIRSGKQTDIKLSNFLSISQACGFHIIMEKGRERIPLC